MIRKFKALGLAMIAVLAMSAVVASAAQAEALFTANSYPTTVTATSPQGNDVFTVDGSSVECHAHFEGTLTEASSTFTVTAHYTNCKAFGFASATVNMNGCHYVFHLKTTSPRTITVTLDCPEGKNVVITAGNCEVQLSDQNEIEHLVATNNHPHVDVRATASGITANRTKDGFLCPLTGTGHVSNAAYNQTNAVTVKPVSGGNTISID